MFRDDFVWGVASSAYQVEGRDPEDGAGKNVWDTFAEAGRIFENQDASVSCDHIHRYKEDFALMRNLGVKAYRFSISWSRLIPDGVGKVNEKAVALYRDMIMEMKKNGIEPYLTLFHWEYPQALMDQGGWLNENADDWFGQYAKVVAENFTDLCDKVFTLNEPQCFIGLGHMRGIHAPGLCMDTKDVFQITHNVLKAHGKAVLALRKYAKQPISIGFAPTCGVAIPASDKPEDIEAAKKVFYGFYNPLENWTWNVTWYSDAVFFGKYPEEGLEKYKEYLPNITKEDMELISQPIDFLGQNVYNGYYVRAGKDGEPEFVKKAPGFPKTGTDWPVTPECLYWGTKFLYERYQMPLFITENGMACHDYVSEDGRVHDPNRIEFLDRYIAALGQSAKEGTDIRGYFEWSFCDNLEWAEGYNKRFGIVYVNYQTQERIAKDSALWYKRVMETNGKSLSVYGKNKTITIENASDCNVSTKKSVCKGKQMIEINGACKLYMTAGDALVENRLILAGQVAKISDGYQMVSLEGDCEYVIE